MTKAVFTVPEQRLGDLASKLTEIYKAADRVGVARPQVVMGERTEHVQTDPVSGYVIRKWADFGVTVTFEPVKLAGWTLRGVLDHDSVPGSVVLRTVPGQDELPETYRTATNVCDHCGTARRRLETFVLLHEDGSYKQVGRQCLRDFLGIDPEAMLRWVTFVRDISAGADEDYYAEGGRHVYRTGVEYFLAVTSLLVRRQGWVSRSVARERGETGDVVRATADDVTEYIFGTGKIAEDFRKEVGDLTDFDNRRAAEALAWVRGMASTSGLSEYLYNLVTVTKGDTVEMANFGLVASAIAAFQRAQEKAEQRARENAGRTPSQFVGEVGKREVFTATVKSVKTFDSDFGVRTMVRFEDAAGNTLVWWTGEVAMAYTPDGVGTGEAEFAEGQTYTVKATVKKHETYKGFNQTVVSRVAKHIEKPKTVRKPRAKKTGQAQVAGSPSSNAVWEAGGWHEPQGSTSVAA
jgi:hypothetical protein